MKSKRSMRDRVQSRRGASLPLALLLTLVCAMAASVVLAASTAAAGRASGLAENDQAYYSVASAVNVFRDELFKDKDKGEGYPITVAVKFDKSDASATPQIVVRTGDKTESGTYTLLERAAMSLLFGGTYGTATDQTNAENVVKGYYLAHPGTGLPGISACDMGSFDLQASGEISADKKDDLALKVSAKVESDGTLIFSFRKTGNASNETKDDLAEFSMKCNADIAYGAIDSGDNSRIEYVTITWTPSTIEKGLAGS